MIHEKKNSVLLFSFILMKLICPLPRSIFHMEQIHTRNCFLEIKACGKIFILNRMEQNEIKMNLFSFTLKFQWLFAFYTYHHLQLIFQYIVPRFHSHPSPERTHTHAYMRFTGLLRECVSFMAQRRITSSKSTIYRHEKQALI